MNDERVFEPEELDAETMAFFSSDKHPNKRDFLNRIRGCPVDSIPYWEVGISPRMVASVLRKPMPQDRFSNDNVSDGIEFCRRTGLAGSGHGIYYSPRRGEKDLNTREGLKSLKARGVPDFSDLFDRVRRRKAAAEGTDIGVWVYTHGPFDPIYMGMNLHDFWLLTLDDPGHLHEVGEYLLEANIAIVKEVIKIGVDWILIADDLAFKSGLFVQPEFLFDYYPERLRRLVDPIKEAGIPVVFHSDGKIDAIIDMLVDCGLDALHPIEPFSNDIFDIAERIDGRMGLVGNIELALMSPEQAYKRTRELIEKLGPRYVPASSHSITDDVTPETYAAFLRAIQEGV